jgi:hypothetical protein
MRGLTLFSFLLFTHFAMANKLVIVQALSKSKRSFITRVGKKDGVYTGSKGTFTAKNFSVIAKATSVTREFAQWTLENSKAQVPFDKGEIVTYNNSTENIWKLVPEDERKRIIQEKIFQPRTSLTSRMSLLRGVFQSTSAVDVDSNLERGGTVLELSYDKEITRHFEIGLGFRMDSERQNVSSSSINLQRYMGVFHMSYFMDKIKSFFNGRVFADLSVGYGVNTISQPSSNESSSGPAYLLPAFNVGIAMPVGKGYDMLFESSVESMNIVTGSSSGGEQTESDTNVRIGVGLRMYLK